MPLLVAFVLALCVPFAQLKTNSVTIECCCPDQTKCKCPDHKGELPQPAMQACHKQAHEGIANELAAFVPPIVPITEAPAISTPASPSALASPHAAPPPQRPDAPS